MHHIEDLLRGGSAFCKLTLLLILLLSLPGVDVVRTLATWQFQPKVEVRR